MVPRPAGQPHRLGDVLAGGDTTPAGRALSLARGEAVPRRPPLGRRLRTNEPGRLADLHRLPCPALDGGPPRANQRMALFALEGRETPGHARVGVWGVHAGCADGQHPVPRIFAVVYYTVVSAI